MSNNPVHERLMVLLKEIDVICKKHDITYYIDGGSAIGAIRHRGFIPWDDDIDIVMTRKNFEKFEKIIDAEIPAKRKYESFERNPKYSMLYARYCDMETTSILRTSLLDVFESGVFIDIFILDPIPNDKKIQEKYLKTFNAYVEYINPYYYAQVLSGNNLEMYKLKFLGLFMNRERLHKYITKKLFSYDEDECDYYCFRFDLFPFIYKKEFFREPVYMMYEGYSSPVPTEIVDYLKVHYGHTWMCIPAAGQEETHNVVTNLNVPYATFKKDYMRFIKDGTLNIYKKFHKKRINRHNLATGVDDDLYRLNAIKNSMKFAKYFEGIDVKTMFENKEYQTLYNDIYKEFLDVQLNKNYTRNNLRFDIGEAAYYAAALLINIGFYYKAIKLLNLQPKAYEDLQERIQKTELLNDYYYKNQLDKYYQLVEENYDSCNDILDFIQGKVKLLIHQGKDEEAMNLIEESIKIYGEDAFLLKYKADILSKTSLEEAKALYQKVVDFTNNGILILEIKDIMGE